MQNSFPSSFLQLPFCPELEAKKANVKASPSLLFENRTFLKNKFLFYFFLNLIKIKILDYFFIKKSFYSILFLFFLLIHLHYKIHLIFFLDLKSLPPLGCFHNWWKQCKSTNLKNRKYFKIVKKVNSAAAQGWSARNFNSFLTKKFSTKIFNF